jgi:hypothetical protein
MNELTCPPDQATVWAVSQVEICPKAWCGKQERALYWMWMKVIQIDKKTSPSERRANRCQTRFG